MALKRGADPKHRFAFTRLDSSSDAPAATFATSSPADLWRYAAGACAAALERRGAFVLIARHAEPLAERSLLSADELARERRYRHDADRVNFVLGRTLVRRLLRPAASLGSESLVRSQHGKPFYPGGPHFNLAHADGHVACAICRTAEIGVDVETRASIGDPRALIPALAHPAERALLESCPDQALATLFRRCWTRKEAALKAVGIGLTADLPSLNTGLLEASPVVFAPGPVRLVDFWSESEEAGGAVAVDPSISAITICWIDVDRA
jgi:4'-phosphopantetheinyl transferase